MADFFRVKIVSKRQVTLPQVMLRDLHLVEGDELEFEVDQGKIRAVRPLKVIPVDYFPPDVLAMIHRRKEEMDAGIDDGEELPLDPISSRLQVAEAAPVVASSAEPLNHFTNDMELEDLKTYIATAIAESK